MENQYKNAHKLSSYHRNKIESSKICGCFYCIKIFSSSEIQEWIDHEQTAICPYCGIDSVIGEHSGISISETFLQGMRNYWF